MSSFCARAINPRTGEVAEAMFMDMADGTYEVMFSMEDIFPASHINIVPVTEEIADKAYQPLPVNPLESCCWLHEGPACSCHVGNAVFCTECGHEVQCHETVRTVMSPAARCMCGEVGEICGIPKGDQGLIIKTANGKTCIRCGHHPDCHES